MIRPQTVGGDTAGPGAAWTMLRRLLGIELAPVGHVERLVSGLGGFLAIATLIWFEQGVVGETGAALLVASMGASAVLLFAVPHGALSQPWALGMGHVASAAIGVTCAKLIPDPTLAAAAAVGLAIAAMHYLRAIHPPGGATALSAVVGGPQVAALGYGFVLTPVLVNVGVMLALAVAINALFPWRRYPAALGKLRAPEPAPREHEDFVAALRRIGTFIDIDEDDFHRIETLAREAAAARRMDPAAIALGRCYSNGAFGDEWSVRTIFDEAAGPEGDVIWRTVAGRGRGETGHCTRRAFADWADCEVERQETVWVRRERGPGDA